METKPETNFIIIPIEKISEDALLGLIDEFILREGTDYGQKEFSLLEKQNQIKKQLQSGTSVIVFDTLEQSPSIVRKEHLR